MRLRKGPGRHLAESPSESPFSRDRQHPLLVTGVSTAPEECGQVVGQERIELSSCAYQAQVLPLDERPLVLSILVHYTKATHPVSRKPDLP